MYKKVKTDKLDTKWKRKERRNKGQKEVTECKLRKGNL
jgi:hypothetical protein